MVYSILAAKKLHLSKSAHSLKETITLKKTIDRLSKNLNSLENKELIMHNYPGLVKQQVKDDHAVIIIDNSDIARSARRKLEVLSEIRNGSTGKITQGYLTSMKNISAAEKGFISETHENLCCLESLSENFSKKCALDRYRYFLSRGERFVIRAKKTGMLFITDRPAASWMWRCGIKELTAWISKIKATRLSGAK